MFSPHGELVAALVCIAVATACVFRHWLSIREQRGDAKKYVSVALALIMVCIGVLEIFGAVVGTAYFALVITQEFIYPVGCEEFVEDDDGPFSSSQSPDGKWIAQINEETCGFFGGTPITTYLTIHSANAKNNRSSSARAFEAEDVDHAKVKWIDNNTVEIGLSNNPQPLPTKYRQFSLRYVLMHEQRPAVQTSHGDHKQ